MPLKPCKMRPKVATVGSANTIFMEFYSILLRHPHQLTLTLFPRMTVLEMPSCL
ncbi:hypothetical protein GYH30_050819 [Glycine max]|nr:hypothetical protein GYH30_050819 [Glycine max]